MGQSPRPVMIPAPLGGKGGTRSSGYHQKALAEIRNSLLPFANSCDVGAGAGVGPGAGGSSSAASTISTLSTTSGVSSASSASNGLDKEALARQAHAQLVSMGYPEVSSPYFKVPF